MASVESFHATFRRECLDAEYFAHLREAKILIEQWRWEYNTQRPHSSLGYRSPAEVGAQVRAAMQPELQAIAVAVPVASSAATAEEAPVEVRTITPETLS